MRWSTPRIRVSDNGKAEISRLSLKRKKGYQYIKKPSKNSRAVRLRMWKVTSRLGCPLNLSKLKLMAAPTANKKEGNTRSVGVKPCHAACSRGS